MTDSPAGKLRSQLAGMDEDEFLACYGNCVGKIRTPYNRPQLESELAVFFVSGETRQSLLRSVSPLDGAICYLVSRLGSCTAQQIVSFFVPAQPKQTVSDAIDNLRRRLILIADRSDGSLRINGVLEQPLLENKTSLDSFLDCAAQPGLPALGELSRAWEPELFIGTPALLAAASTLGKTTKNIVSLSRQLDCDRTFPLIPRINRPVVLNLLLNLIATRACETETSGRTQTHRLDETALSSLLGLRPLELAVLISCPDNPGAQNAALGAVAVLSQNGPMNQGRLFALIKLLLLKEGQQTFSPWIVLFRLVVLNAIRVDESANAMANPAVCQASPVPRSAFVAGGGGEFSFYGDPGPDDAPLAFLAQIRTNDRMSTYTLSYRGYQALRQFCHEPEAVSAQFEGTPADAAIRKFKTEFERFSLYEGFLLECSDPLVARTVSSMPSVSPYIIKAVGDSAFLLSRADIDRWAPALNQFIGLIPSMANLQWDKDRRKPLKKAKPPRRPQISWLTGETSANAVKFENDELKTELRALVKNPDEYKENLMTDIERSLVFDARQLAFYRRQGPDTPAGSRPSQQMESKLRELIDSQNARVLIRCGGKTLMVTPISLENPGTPESSLRFLEYPSKTEKTAEISSIQLISRL